MALKPVRDLVYCIPIDDPDRSRHGELYVPEKAKQRRDQGIVKYTGPEVQTVQRGDHVLFSGYDGSELNMEDEGKLLIVRESTIAAIVPESTHRLVTEEEMITFLGDVKGELLTQIDMGGRSELTREAVELVCERLEAKVEDYFYTEGLRF